MYLSGAATPSLTLKVEVCFNGGFCMQILEAELPNSSVQPGFVYTAKYSVVPNDILSVRFNLIKTFIQVSQSAII